jgi:hypothetical protein
MDVALIYVERRVNLFYLQVMHLDAEVNIYIDQLPRKKRTTLALLFSKIRLAIYVTQLLFIRCCL